MFQLCRNFGSIHLVPPSVKTIKHITVHIGKTRETYIRKIYYMKHVKRSRISIKNNLKLSKQDNSEVGKSYELGTKLIG